MTQARDPAHARLDQVRSLTPHPADRITTNESPGDPLDELVATGLAGPARGTAVRSARRFRTIATGVDLGAALDAERKRFDGLI